jgi:signal transduction histidine kinase
MKILHRHPVAVMAVLFVLGMGVVLAQLYRLSNQVMHTSALEGTAAYAQALVAFRTLYSSEVVGRVDGSKVVVSHEYREIPGAIPLPATLSIELGQAIAAQGSGMDVRLYSAYPFPWRAATGGPTDDFERVALETLTASPEQPFYRFEDHDGELFLRYAVADRMRPACVACHNGRADSPKRDWKEGDVRGVLAITRPLQVVRATTNAGLAETVLLMGGTTLAWLGLLALVVSSLRSTAAELEQHKAHLEERVAERTRELGQAQTQLAQKEKLASVGQMVAGVAHEINNPINFVGGASVAIEHKLDDFEKLLFQLMDDPEGKTEVGAEIKSRFGGLRQSVGTIENGVERVKAIVLALRTFSRSDAPERAPADLVAGIESTLQLAGFKLAKVTLIRDLQPLPPVVCHPGQVNQVVLNVVMNAIQAVSEVEGRPPTVTIRTHVDGEFAVITVTDNGVGISDEHKSRIFDPFFTTKAVGEGTGLGLSISYAIVKAHGGRIEVESTPGVGTTFRIWLPTTS